MGLFWRENGLGPLNPTKKLAHWVDLLIQPLSRTHVFEIFRGEPPLICLNVNIFCKSPNNQSNWQIILIKSNEQELSNCELQLKLEHSVFLKKPMNEIIKSKKWEIWPTTQEQLKNKSLQIVLKCFDLLDFNNFTMYYSMTSYMKPVWTSCINAIYNGQLVINYCEVST